MVTCFKPGEFRENSYFIIIPLRVQNFDMFVSSPFAARYSCKFLRKDKITDSGHISSYYYCLDINYIFAIEHFEDICS